MERQLGNNIYFIVAKTDSKREGHSDHHLTVKPARGNIPLVRAAVPTTSSVPLPGP
jgi:hypothetical protein